MILRFSIDVLVWLLVWVASWGLYGLMLRRQINYVERFPITSVFFLTISILIAILFRGTLAQVVTGFVIFPFIAIAFAYVLAIAIYYLSHRYLKKPERLIAENPHEHFLALDYRYLTSKSFELMFQQVMIVLLILTIHSLTTTMVNVMVIFGVVFAVAHVPIYRLIGTSSKKFKLVYFVASLMSAIVFPLLILRVSYGFVYSYIIHSSFYALCALFFWGRNTVLSEKE